MKAYEEDIDDYWDGKKELIEISESEKQHSIELLRWFVATKLPLFPTVPDSLLEDYYTQFIKYLNTKNGSK